MFYSRGAERQFDKDIVVVLAAQHTFAQASPWTLTEDANGEVDQDIFIDEWLEERAAMVSAGSLPDNDNGQLFSAYDFAGACVGYASMSAMCTASHSGGINQMTFANAFNAVVVAHEIGLSHACKRLASQR